MRIHNIKIFKESKRKLKDINFYSKNLYKIFTNVIEMARKWRLYMKPCSSSTMRYKQQLEHWLSVLKEIMFHLLPSEYNNSWNMVCVSIIGNHVPLVVIRL